MASAWGPLLKWTLKGGIGAIIRSQNYAVTAVDRRLPAHTNSTESASIYRLLLRKPTVPAFMTQESQG
jgi:hypothetical protein